MDDKFKASRLDTVTDNEMTEKFEGITETEKESIILKLRDAANKTEAMKAVTELKSDNLEDMMAAMANTDFGSTVENSGVR